MLTLPGTGTKMNTEPISGGTHDTEHNQGVFLAQADGTRITLGADGNDRLNVASLAPFLSGGVSVSLGVHTYSAGFQVGAPAQLVTVATAGVYDLALEVFDIYGALATTATVWLFSSDQTANLGGDGTSWDATAASAFVAPVGGFNARPVSTAASTKQVLADGRARVYLPAGAVWAVTAGGSGLVAAGTESIQILMLAVRVS